MIITADNAARQAGEDSSTTGEAAKGIYWDKRKQTTPETEITGSSYTSFGHWRSDATRYDNTLPIAYRPPVNSWLSADRQETQVRGLPGIYRATNVGEAMSLYWSDPTSRQLIINAARIHYAGNPNFVDQWAEGFWSDIVNQANSYGAPAPWETLQMILSGQGASSDGPGGSSGQGGYSGGGGGGYSSGGGGGGQVRLTDPTSARGLLMQTMQGVLGRNPTEREYKQFLATLNESEMANPQTVSVEGNNAVYSGGIDPSVLAMEFAQDAEDYRERQGDMYFQTFMRSLAGGV